MSAVRLLPVRLTVLNREGEVLFNDLLENGKVAYEHVLVHYRHQLGVITYCDGTVAIVNQGERYETT